MYTVTADFSGICEAGVIIKRAEWLPNWGRLYEWDSFDGVLMLCLLLQLEGVGY
jgi:hypothetical protein